MASSRPVVGLICCTRFVGVEPAQAVMTRYVRAVMRYSDAAVLLVPTLPELMAGEEVISRLDGLLLTGSPSNLEPARYGNPDPSAPGPFDQGRDTVAASLIHGMLAAGKPVFGICRGLQEINVAFGGTLRRDLSDPGTVLPHHAPDGVDLATMFDHHHPVDLTPGGVLAGAFGREQLTVNSVHFQGINRLGVGLSVEARAPDGVIEAVEAVVAGAQLLAVQWHPEWATEDHPQSQTFFRLLGAALRRQPLTTVAPVQSPLEAVQCP